MDEFTIFLICLVGCIPVCTFLFIIEKIDSRKNYILLEYIDYLEKQLCTKKSDKELLKRIFILKRQNKYIVDTADREIKNYKKVLKGE